MTARESYNFGVDTKAKQLYTETTNQGEIMVKKRFWILNVLTKNSGIKDGDKLLSFDEVVYLLNNLSEENEQLKSENKRLTDKLNKTALELVDECISQGKAAEISEMSYIEFLDYRAENGKPMELQL